jgi:vacuolar-type H+-ATPase subunit F/Vma7
MALDKTTLMDELEEAFDRAFSENREDSDPVVVRRQLVEDIANAIDRYVKTATVTVIAEPGKIQVVGSPGSQSNVVPIVIQGSPVTGGLS